MTGFAKRPCLTVSRCWRLCWRAREWCSLCFWCRAPAQSAVSDRFKGCGLRSLAPRSGRCRWRRFLFRRRLDALPRRTLPRRPRDSRFGHLLRLQGRQSLRAAHARERAGPGQLQAPAARCKAATQLAAHIGGKRSRACRPWRTCALPTSLVAHAYRRARPLARDGQLRHERLRAAVRQRGRPDAGVLVLPGPLDQSCAAIAHRTVPLVAGPLRAPAAMLHTRTVTHK